jgi:hypothetical protein
MCVIGHDDGTVYKQFSFVIVNTALQDHGFRPVGQGPAASGAKRLGNAASRRVGDAVDFFDRKLSTRPNPFPATEIM